MTMQERAATRALVAREIAAIEVARLASTPAPRNEAERRQRVDMENAAANALAVSRAADVATSTMPGGAAALAWATSHAPAAASEALAAAMAHVESAVQGGGDAMTALVSAASVRADAARARRPA